jgi:ketosteroid isomerase-like protein
LPADLTQAIEADHRALDALVRGDPEPKKKMFSHGEDVTLANPLGPPARGWTQVEETLERAVTNLREGGPIRFERISEYATPDLAYIVEFERWRGKVTGSPATVSMALRVTTIFRLEDDGWRIVHRHADPITTARPIESIFEEAVVEAG